MKANLGVLHALGGTVALVGVFLSGRWSAPTHFVPEAQARALVPDPDSIRVMPPPDMLSSVSSVDDRDSQRRVPAPNTTMPPAAPARPRSIRDGVAAFQDLIVGQLVFSGDDRDIAAKYDGLDSNQLQMVLMLLRPLRGAEGQRINQLQLERGNFTQHFIAPGEKFEFPKSKGTELSTFGFSSTPIGDGTDFRTVEFPADQFPEFNALSNEWWWIMRELKGTGVTPCGF
jgi:hypothetical protein